MGVIPEKFYIQLEKAIDKVGTCEDLQRLTDRIAEQVGQYIEDAVKRILADNQIRLKPLLKFLELLKPFLEMSIGLDTILKWAKALVEVLKALRDVLLSSFAPAYFALKSVLELAEGLPAEYSKIQTLINRKIEEKMCDGMSAPQIIFPPIPDISAIISTLDPLMKQFETYLEESKDK